MSAKSETPRTDAFLRSQAPFTRDDVRKILESVERDLAAKETEVERLREALVHSPCKCVPPSSDLNGAQHLGFKCKRCAALSGGEG